MKQETILSIAFMSICVLSFLYASKNIDKSRTVENMDYSIIGTCSLFGFIMSLLMFLHTIFA